MIQSIGRYVPLAIPGLDDILFGGVAEQSVILVQGAPGAGKTTFGVQFLYKGILECKEPGIYITFEEMPEQIYRDMRRFGWDLQTLERQQQLRVLCVNPEIFVQSLEESSSFLLTIIEEMGCRRLVVDSISLIRSLASGQFEQRAMAYKLISSLRRLQVTALLLFETTGQADGMSWEHFLADGIVTLSSRMFYEHYRKRTIEILKMRGRKSVKGQHIFKIGHDGIVVVPPLDIMTPSCESFVPHALSTGVADLDEMMGGGFAPGTFWVLEADTQSHHFCHPEAVADVVIYIEPSIETIQRLKLRVQQQVGLNTSHGADFLHIIECSGRSMPEELKTYVHSLEQFSDSKMDAFLHELMFVIAENHNAGRTCVVSMDVHPGISVDKSEFLWETFSNLLWMVQSYGVVTVVSLQTHATSQHVRNKLIAWASGVLSTWIDGRYQVFQVKKTPTGYVSEPFVVLTSANGIQLI